MKIGSVYYPSQYFGTSKLIRGVNDLAEDHFDMIVFWGGTDISPGIYGEPNIASQNPDYVRDKVEVAVFREAQRKKIPMIGICRGAQLFCALTGGSLWQHVSGHGHTHSMVMEKDVGSLFLKGQKLITSSVHHQLMRPPAHHEILAYAEHVMSPKRISAREEVKDCTEKEPEVSYDPENKLIMIQGHPEYDVTRSGELSKLTFNLIKRYFGVTLNV